jgi:hypothetical protein
MPISVYDINAHLKADSELANIAGKQMNFFPVVGYGEENPPFVIYFYNPSIPSVEAFWNRFDTIRYSIYDSDADRLFKIAERFIDILGAADTVQKQGGVAPNNVRVLSSQLLFTSVIEPIEKEGWYQMDLDFGVYSVSYQLIE